MNNSGSSAPRAVVYALSVLILISTIIVATVVFGKGTATPEVTTEPASTTETTTETTTEDPGPSVLLSDIMENQYKTKSLTSRQILGRVVSEDLGIDCRLVFGTTDDVLNLGAGMHKCSSLPGMKTPIDPAASCPIIAGHCRTVFVGFSKIDPNVTELPEGLTITLQMPYGDYVYEIEKVEIMPADDFQFSDHRASFGNFEPDRAIFYTCYPFGVVGYVKTDRLFIYTKLIDGMRVEDDISVKSDTNGNEGIAVDNG